MTPSWRTLEREVIDILRQNNFTLVAIDGETFVTVGAYDLPMKFSLSTFARELAQRLEKVR